MTQGRRVLQHKSNCMKGAWGIGAQEPLSRGRKAKARRAKEKYADQDEDDRRLALQILGSAGGGHLVAHPACTFLPLVLLGWVLHPSGLNQSWSMVMTLGRPLLPGLAIVGKPLTLRAGDAARPESLLCI